MQLVHTEEIIQAKEVIQVWGVNAAPDLCSATVPSDADQQCQTTRTNAQWNPSSAA